MSEKTAIYSEGAPQPFGHFSQAVKVDNMIFISGQLPLNPKDGKPIGGSVEEQCRRVLDNMSALLQDSGGQMSNVLMTTLYLTSLADFPAFDKISKDYFFFLPPSRTTVVVSSLPGGSKICLDAIARFSNVELEGKAMI